MGVLLGILSLLFIPLPSHTFLWKAVNNFAHLPLFGVVALLLLVISRKVFKEFGWSPGQHYGMVFIGVLTLALLTEGLQTFSVTRQFEISDIVRDLVGAMCGFGLLLTYEKHLPGAWAKWSHSPYNTLIRVVVLIVILAALIPTIEWVYVYWDRASRFPSLLEFSSDWEMKFVQPSNSELQVMRPPEGWEKPVGDKVGHILFYTTTYPGFRIEEPYPDWRDYSSLRFDIFSELPMSQSISIRIDDAHHNRTYEDRFNRRITIFPGPNHIQIPIDDIRFAPKDREMDLSAIRRILLFTVSPPKEFTLFVDSIRLE